MILSNLLLIDNNDPVNIQIKGDKITSVLKSAISGSLQLIFDNAMVFPGLINSHDHLDFNLFPQLGDRIYCSYTGWGKYIHENHKNEISGVLKVPILLREEWGVLKNLICGVTTVVNHGENVKISDKLISVYEEYHCLHSVQFEKNWKIKLNNPLKLNRPVVVHVGEGTNEEAHEEINQLIHWNLLRKTLIGVHAVAMSEKQARKFKAIIWCPQSNYFLLNKTAPIHHLKEHTKVLFGTDSTLTSNWNIWEHIRLARETKMLSDIELYRTLNLNPAAVWKTQNGKIKSGSAADVIVTKIKNKQSGMDAFFSVAPEDILLVLHKGNIRLFDETLYGQLTTEIDLSDFSRININGAQKYIQGDVPGLIKKIRQYYPEASFPVTVSEA